MTLSTTRAHILAGKIKALAVSSAQRLAEFPDLPTLAELGYRDLVVTTWYSLAGPAGLPRDIVARLNAAVNKAIDAPEVRRHLANDMVQTKAMTPAEATEFMQNEVNKWAPVARRIAASN